MNGEYQKGALPIFSPTNSTKNLDNIRDPPKIEMSRTQERGSHNRIFGQPVIRDENARVPSQQRYHNINNRQISTDQLNSLNHISKDSINIMPNTKSEAQLIPTRGQGQIRITANEVENKENFRQQKQQPVVVQVPDVSKKEIQDQLEKIKREIFLACQQQMRDSELKSEKSSRALEKMKSNLDSQESEIKDILDQLRDFESQIAQLDSQSTGFSLGINENYMNSKEIEENLTEAYSDRIEKIGCGQKQIRQVLVNVKQDLLKDITHQVSVINREIKENDRNQTEKTINLVKEMKNNWEKRLSMIFQQMNNKISVIEKSITSIKRDSEPNGRLDVIQNEVYSKFEQSVRNFQNELLQLKSRIDGKLDKKELHQVIQGYQSLNDDSRMLAFTRQVEAIHSNLSRAIEQVEISNQEFECRIQSFESLVHNSTKDYQRQIKSSAESDVGMKNKIESDLAGKFDYLEESINQMSQQFDLLDRSLKHYDANIFKMKAESDQRFREISQNLIQLDGEINRATECNRTKQLNQKQNMESKASALEQTVLGLFAQMENVRGSIKNNFQLFQSQVEKQQKSFQTDIEICENQMEKDLRLDNTQDKGKQPNILVINCSPVTHLNNNNSIQQQLFNNNNNNSVSVSNDSKSCDTSNSIFRQKNKFQEHIQREQIKQGIRDEHMLNTSHHSIIDNLKVDREFPAEEDNIMEEMGDQFNEYLKKYQQFSKQVNSFISNKQVFQPLDRLILNASKRDDDQSSNRNRNTSPSPNQSGTKVKLRISGGGGSKTQEPGPTSSSSYPSISPLNFQDNDQSTVYRNQNFQIRQQVSRCLKEIISPQGNANKGSNNQSSNKGRDNFQSNDILEKNKISNRGQLSRISEKEYEEDQLVYQLDDNGYLLDENGEYIKDENGKAIQLSKEHIQYLRSTNLLEQ